MHIDVLTLFPEIFPGPLGTSVVGRAAERGLATVGTVDVREFASDARGTVDEKPYGGGPGMLMMVEPLTLALEIEPLVILSVSFSASPITVSEPSPLPY